MHPYVSVVIPTKDRYATLIPVLSSIITSISAPDLQLVIQDNTIDNTEILEYLNKIEDSRIIYRHTIESLSVVENTEAALDLATGEFITFIGDDDLVSPYIVDVAKLLAKTGAEAITYPSAYYWWPSVVFANPSRYFQPGAFWFPERVDGTIHTCKPSVELDKVLQNGAAAIFNLPRLYHGLVRRDVVVRLKQHTGHYVNGASPDMALAVALALTVKQHIVLNYPLTIYGSSKGSGGGWTAENKHYGRLEDQKHLPISTVENWCEKLPRIWSEHTIYPQTAREVLHAFSLSDKIDYVSFYASMSANEPHLRKYLVHLVVRHLQINPLDIFHFIATLIKKSIGRMRRYLNSCIFGMPYKLYFFKSPDECIEHLRTIPCPTNIAANFDSNEKTP